MFREQLMKVKEAVVNYANVANQYRDVKGPLDAFLGRNPRGVISLPQAYSEVATIERRLGKEQGSLRQVLDRGVAEAYNDLFRPHQVD